MIIQDYSSLQVTVAEWLRRETDTDFVAQVPTFIQLAENEMYTGPIGRTANGTVKPLRCREMQFRGRALLNEEYEWLPGASQSQGGFSFLETEWCTLIYTDAAGNVTETPMDYKDLPDFLRDKTVDGQPRLYTIYGEQIRFKPDPSKNPPADPAKWEFEISYYGRFPVLSDENPSNDILVKYPNLYLYGSLLQAEGYIENDKRIAYWRNAYAGGVEQANRIAESGRRGVRAIGPPQ